MIASPGPSLQVNPFAQLSLASACPIALRAIAPAAGPVQARALRDDPTLHQQLIRQQLQHPQPVALRVEDGVGIETLQHALAALLEAGDPLANLFHPCASVLHAGCQALKLPPLVQLLLSAAQQQSPAHFDHAVRAMALAGALAWHAKAPASFVQRALLTGLVHDIGDVYVQPAYLQAAGRQLDLAEYRQLAAHPHVGAMLLGQLSDCPPDVVRAVGEHHERLDGTGYPFQRLGSAISPLGQLMAVAELVLGVADARPAVAARASFALKFVPGEFSGLWAGPITHWADTEPTAEPDPAQAADAMARVGALDASLQRIQSLAEQVADTLDGSAQRVALRAAHRLRRLRIAWNAMGLWSVPAEAVEPQERFDIALAVRELRYRLGTIGRDCLWPENDPSVQGDARLVPLWLALAKA